MVFLRVCNHAALPGQMHMTRLVHSYVCQALRVWQRADHLRKIGNPQCRIIALGPGKNRHSIFFLIIVFITSNYRIIS